MNDKITKSEVRDIVNNQEESITKIISPSDIRMQDIDSWDNADKDLLREELGASMGDAWTYDINHPYGDLIEQVAITRFIEDMTRIPMDHLNPEYFVGIEDMIVEGYWPNETSREEIEELVYEWKEDIDYFHEYESEVRQEIEASILEARLKNI